MTLYYPKKEYKLDTSGLYLGDDYKYKLFEYFNFYQYIVPSYSFRIHSDAPLYAKNRYLRILDKSSRINPLDTYIRIPVLTWHKVNDGEFVSPYDSETDRYYDIYANSKTPISERTQFLYITRPNQFIPGQLYSAIT